MLTLVSCLLFAATLTSSSPTSHSSSRPAPRSYNDNLTPDGYYHDRYHAIMSMASYGDYNDLCPAQTFSKATELKNFPNSPFQEATFGKRYYPRTSLPGCKASYIGLRMRFYEGIG